MPRDFWIGLVTLGFAAFYWLQADKIRISPLDGPVGASGLPKSLAWALAVLSAIMLVRALYQKLRQVQPPEEAGAGKVPLAEWLRPHLRAIGMLAIGAAYLLVIPFLGYALSIMLLLAAVSLYIGTAPGWRTVAFVVVGGIFFQAFFVEFLDIPLPEGRLVQFILNAST